MFYISTKAQGVMMQFEFNGVREKAYGCISVKVGDESKVAKVIRSLFPAVETCVVKQAKHRSRQGIKSYAYDIMLPGYILFCTEEDISVSQFMRITSVQNIVFYDDYKWSLRGDDLFYAKWAFNNKGTIGVSVVFMENDEIVITDGPLKDLKGRIIRIDKRNRNALVSLGFRKQNFKVWLAFEWMTNRIRC
jgi:hypothetical protein